MRADAFSSSEEAPQPPELVDLRLHTLLERAVEVGELCGLP